MTTQKADAGTSALASVNSNGAIQMRLAELSDYFVVRRGKHYCLAVMLGAVATRVTERSRYRMRVYSRAARSWSIPATIFASNVHRRATAGDLRKANSVPLLHAAVDALLSERDR